jgi:hypothetical protein
MMHDQDDQDLRLARLLQAVRAEADPALWTRVRARIESRPRVPALLAWAMRPAALAASLALLVVSAALALLLAADASVSTATQYATLADALLAERDAEASAPAAAPPPAGPAARDSGSGR